MKKTAKSLLLVMVMAVLLLGLTGCGENKKLVATKEDEDSTFGKYKETIEITFKDKKADKIVMTRELEDDKISEFKDYIDYLNTDDSVKYEIDGNKLIITMDAKAYAESEDVSDEDLSRKSLKEELEDDGYKVK
mgnify:FL=1